MDQTCHRKNLQPVIPSFARDGISTFAFTLHSSQPIRRITMSVSQKKTFLTLFTLACAWASVMETSYAQEHAPGTTSQSLFNGKNLADWDGDPRFWRVENGEIIGETTDSNKAEKNTFLIYRGGEFGDFDLRFKYRVTGYNSGIQYRSTELGKWSVGGYQSDFEDRWHKSGDTAIDKFSGMFFDEQGRMFMGQRGQSVIVRSNPTDPKKPNIEVVGSVGDAGELEKHIQRDGWNEMRVIARGFTFMHIINNHVMSVGLDEDTAGRKASGILAIQLHSGPAMKIRIKDVAIVAIK